MNIAGHIAVALCFSSVFSVCDYIDPRLDCPRSEPAQRLALSNVSAGSCGAAISVNDRVLVAHIAGGKTTSEPTRIAATMLNGDNLETLHLCNPEAPEDGIDPDVAGASASRADCPVVAAGSTGAAVAYRSWTSSTGTSTSTSDGIRIVFLDRRGCLDGDETLPAARTVSDDDASRILATPQVQWLRDDVYLVLWLSTSRDDRVFDDRVQARLVRASTPSFAPSVASATGDVVDLDLPDRWLIRPTAIAFRDDDGRVGFALGWFHVQATRISVSLALFADSLERISDVVVLDDDEIGSGDASLVERRIAGDFDAAASAFVLAWSEVVKDAANAGSHSAIAARLVLWDGKLTPNTHFHPTADQDSDAYSPQVRFLGGHDIFFAWKSLAGGVAQIRGSVVRSDGRRRFTTVSCGPGAFALSTSGKNEAFAPSATVVGSSRVFTSWTEAINGDWRFYGSTLEIPNILRGND